MPESGTSYAKKNEWRRHHSTPTMHRDKHSFSVGKLPQRVKVGNDSDDLRNSLRGETHAIVRSLTVPCMPLWATVCNKCMLHHTRAVAINVGWRESRRITAWMCQ